MEITSPAFLPGQPIPEKYTCKGENINPEIRMNSIPPEAKSLALIMDDPDAPHGTFVHWVLFNISPNITEIPQNSVPIGSMQGINGAGKSGYLGPCPPSGTHRYFFKVYALDTTLGLGPKTTKEQLLEAMEGHSLEIQELMGTFTH